MELGLLSEFILYEFGRNWGCVGGYEWLFLLMDVGLCFNLDRDWC